MNPRDCIEIATCDLGSARWLHENGHARAGWLRLSTALHFMYAAAIYLTIDAKART